MKKAVFVFGVVVFVQLLTLRSAKADGLPLGSWKLANAFCSNPNYKMSPDEQAEVDSIHHLGDMWNDDSFDVTEPTKGLYTNTTTFSGLACSQTQEMLITTAADGRVKVHYFNGSDASTQGTPDGNTQIHCSHIQDADEYYFVANLKSDSFDLLLAGDDTPAPTSSDDNSTGCGWYHRHYEKK